MIYPMSNRRSSSKNSEGEGSSPAFRRGERKPYWDASWLRRAYVDGRRSAFDIASECGGTEGNVLYFLKKHGIPRRTMSEVRSFKKWGAVGASNPMHGRCGDKNPRWIDGSSPERQRMYAQSFWKELVHAVYARDGYKCVRCSSPHEKGRRLHAHHVKPWAGNPNARFDLRNIVTLCEKCHRWVHSKENVTDELLSR